MCSSDLTLKSDITVPTRPPLCLSLSLSLSFLLFAISDIVIEHMLLQLCDFGSLLGCLWGCLGTYWAPFGLHLDLFGYAWPPFGSQFGLLGTLWECIEPFWGIFWCSGCHCTAQALYYAAKGQR